MTDLNSFTENVRNHVGAATEVEFTPTCTGEMSALIALICHF